MGFDKDNLRRFLKDKSEPRKVVQMLSEQEWAEVTSVELGLNDASIPPQYHRSYSMIFTAETIKVEVVSYGKLLATYMTVVPYGKFIELKDILIGQRLRKVEKLNFGMCGGLGGYVILKRWEEILLSAYISGNSMLSEGDLSFDGFLFEAVCVVFPWLEEMVADMIAHVEGIDMSYR